MGGHLLKPLRDALGKRSRRGKTGVKSGGRDPVSEKVNLKNCVLLNENYVFL